MQPNGGNVTSGTADFSVVVIEDDDCDATPTSITTFSAAPDGDQPQPIHTSKDTVPFLESSTAIKDESCPIQNSPIAAVTGSGCGDDDVDDEDCFHSGNKRYRYEHEIAVERHRKRISSARTSAQETVKATETLRLITTDIACLLFPESGKPLFVNQNDEGKASSFSPPLLTSKALEGATQIVTANVPAALAAVRREHRKLSTLTIQANQILDEMKQRRRALIQQFLDYQAQLTALRRQTREELSAFHIPKFTAVLPQLCSKEEFEASRIENALRLHGANRNVEHSSADDDVINQPQQNEDVADYYLNWLKLDLACRANDMSKINDARGSRQAEEEKLKLLKKRESDLAAKLTPIEKELTRLLSSVSSLTSGSGTAGTSTIPQTPSSLTSAPFPSKAYSLPLPLFHLFTQLYSYRLVNYDTSIDVRLLFQSPQTQSANTNIQSLSQQSQTPDSPVSSPKFSLFHASSGRVQVIIDKGSTPLPPTTYLKAAPLFPLTVRFTYFPNLNVVSAMCQFPKVIGSDITFLADLCFQNDDGTVSPNSLHHVVTSINQLIPASSTSPHCINTDEGLATNTIISDAQMSTAKIGEKEFNSNTTTTSSSLNANNSHSKTVSVAQRIAAKISELQLGRPYRWAQILAGLPQAKDSISTLPSIPQDVVIDVHRFVVAFRERVCLRAWTLHLEECLKHQPSIIPPSGATLPVAINAHSSSCASMIESFVASTARDFIAAGGSSTDVIMAADRDVRFLKGHLAQDGIQFTVYIAIPLDSRNAEFRIQLRSYPKRSRYRDEEINFKVFSLIDPVEAELDPHKVLAQTLPVFSADQQSVIEQAAEASQFWGEGGTLLNAVTSRPGYLPTTMACSEIENRQLQLISQMLPAASFGWEEIGNFWNSSMTCGSNNTGATIKKPTHFCDSKLESIQDLINIGIPQSYGGRDNGPQRHLMLIIQLISLTNQLQKWIRDSCIEAQHPSDDKDDPQKIGGDLKEQQIYNLQQPLETLNSCAYNSSTSMEDDDSIIKINNNDRFVEHLLA